MSSTPLENSNSGTGTGTSSESSHNDDPIKDPDYVPSDIEVCEEKEQEKAKVEEKEEANEEVEDTTDEEEDEDEDEDDDDEDNENMDEELLKKLTPLLMGIGSPFQMPMMLIIQGNAKKSNSEEEDDDDEEEEEHDEGDEDAEFEKNIKMIEKEMEAESKEKECCKKELRRSSRKRNRSSDDITKIMKEYNKEERTYIEKLSKDDKDRVLQTELRIRKIQNINDLLPIRFKILQSPMDDGSKRIILAKLEQFQRMHEGTGEYFKLRNWLNAVNRLPLGRFKELPIHANSDSTDSAANIEKVSVYLSSIKTKLDETVYGHMEAKEQILRILAQWVSNPGSGGHCIGIQGPPGCGKTSLLKDGVCKALDLPFSLISLGCYGSDGSALTGHHFTYEGSTYGKISETLVKAQYMNPILYFDELDKISQTPKGEEVASVLIHLTDSTQNDHFSDNYFSEIPLDMSKCLIVFSYNDESLVNPVLKDRMITIRVSGYTKKEKLEIAQNYLVPRLLATYNLKKDDILFDNTIIEEIIERVAPEEGVRNLKRGIDAIISWINMRRYVPNLSPAFSEKEKKEDANSSVKIELPIKITSHIVKKYLKDIDNSISKHVLASMYT
jgi:ATP-dependent Lon protease